MEDITAKKYEIMAPVGTFDSLSAAIKAGADSVYFGIEQLNMRARSTNNFTTEDLKNIVIICKKNNVGSYLTLNTIVYDHDIALMKKICDVAKKSGVSAVIASDMATIQYANSIELEVHCSTQINVTNIEAVKFYSKFADVIVLARELTQLQIKKICAEIKKQNVRGPGGKLIQIEIFVHGALCVAISGKCYMSLATYNSSANRGACLQNCRRAYRVIDEETGDELKIENKYIMSPSDLCTIGFMDKLIDAGATIFKIEGRGKPPEYVFTTVKCYKEAIESIKAGTYTKKKIEGWEKELATVYNRGFWQGGYYMGKKINEWSATYGAKTTKEKKNIGPIEHVYTKTLVAQINVQENEFKIGDELVITGPTTGIVKMKVDNIKDYDGKEISEAKKGTIVTIKTPELVRKSDKVYVFKDK